MEYLWTPRNSVLEKPYRVLLSRGEFVDESRDNRVVPYKIYYPAEHDLKKMPVIIWSHGFGGNRDGASFISRFLAGQGYTLVHITHRGTDSSLWEGETVHPWDVLRKVEITRKTTLCRMHDVPFVLDQLPEWIRQNPEIGRYMDMKHIGMSGHSFGAMTAQVMAGMKIPDLDGNLILMPEKRFSCGILYSPVPIAHLSNAPASELYGSIGIPLLHMTGTEDNSPLRDLGYKDRLVIRQNVGNAEQYVQVLDGGDHMIYNGTRGKLEKNPNRDEHEALILDAVFAFWEAYLKGNDGAKKWLSVHYG